MFAFAILSEERNIYINYKGIFIDKFSNTFKIAYNLTRRFEMNQVDKIIKNVIDNLENVKGIDAIVLAGSRARKTNDENSDIDIGIYYNDDFKPGSLNDIACRLDDQNRGDLISGLGDWGPWLDGGGWLLIDGYQVDLIFRQTEKLEEIIDQVQLGKITNNYHPGHPHAYMNYMYMGELAICKILYSRDDKIKKLKSKALVYPDKLAEQIIKTNIFEANLSLMMAKDNIYNDDIYYLVGHYFRVISCLNQVIFSLNKEYLINEKKAVKMIDGFKIKPKDYKDRVDQVFELTKTNTKVLYLSYKELESLLEDVNKLVEG